MTPSRPPDHDRLVRKARGEADRNSDADAAYRRWRTTEGTIEARVAKMRSSARWQRVREYVLQRDGGLCGPCRKAGRTEPATQVNHIVAAVIIVRQRGDEALFDTANCEAICVKCHSKVSARERRREA